MLIHAPVTFTSKYLFLLWTVISNIKGRLDSLSSNTLTTFFCQFFCANVFVKYNLKDLLQRLKILNEKAVDGSNSSSVRKTLFNKNQAS